MATHRRIAHISLCGLGCFADAMTTRLDRMMQVTRKPSNKQRVCADSTVSVQDVQACITRHLRNRSTTDLWSCIVSGPDGPRTWSFKSRPDGRWMARFSSLAFDLVCDVCKNTKILSRVLVAALQACVLAGVVKNTSGSEETKFIASVDVTVRILLSWFRQLKVSKKIRDVALKRVSEAEKARVSAVMEKIELNADEAEAAAKESEEDGSESDVDMTFLVSIDSLGLPSSTTGKTTMAEKEGAKDKTFLEKFETGSAALHRMFDNVINSTSSPAPSGSAPSGSAPEGSVPGGSAPGGSAPSGSAPSSSAAAAQGQLRDADLLALARSRRPAFVDTKVASGSKPKAKAKAKAVAKAKAKSMAAQKKRPAAAAEANTAPDAAEYTFMTYDKGKPTERIAICEWCGTKRVGRSFRSQARVWLKKRG